MPDRSWRATNIKFSLMKKTAYLMVGTILLANVLNVSAQGTTRKIITEKKTTQGRMVEDIRKIVPNHFLLVPGIGAQGGSQEEVCKYGKTKE